MLRGSLIRIRSESELELDFLSASCSPAISPPCAPSPPNATLVQCLPPLILAASLPAPLCFKSLCVVYYVVRFIGLLKKFYPFSKSSFTSNCSLLTTSLHIILFRTCFAHFVQSVPTNQISHVQLSLLVQQHCRFELHTLHLTWQPTCFAAGVSERGSLS